MGFACRLAGSDPWLLRLVEWIPWFGVCMRLWVLLGTASTRTIWWLQPTSYEHSNGLRDMRVRMKAEDCADWRWMRMIIMMTKMVLMRRVMVIRRAMTMMMVMMIMIMKFWSSSSS